VTKPSNSKQGGAEKFPGEGAAEKQGQKIASLSLPILYQYQV